MVLDAPLAERPLTVNPGNGSFDVASVVRSDAGSTIDVTSAIAIDTGG
jgi:hypothetical protein